MMYLQHVFNSQHEGVTVLSTTLLVLTACVLVDTFSIYSFPGIPL